MQIKTKIAFVAIVAGSIFLLFLFFSMTSWYNSAVSLEESVKAQFDENKNQYDSLFKKVKEVTQIPEKYKEDFKDVLVSETKAKFGEEGSQAAFQWLKDRDINFDASQYQKIQNVIESSREDFKRSQTELRDKQRKYSTHIKTFFGRMGASLFDMPNELHGELAPQKDLDGDGRLTVLDYPIVIGDNTRVKFNTGTDNEVIDIFK